MALYSYDGVVPTVAENVFIAPSADIIGHVNLGRDASVWYGCVVRADVAPIEIGAGTNIQDGTVIHVDRDRGTYIGKGVTIGHQATLHACTVEDFCLIGMKALILDGAVIGANSLVAAGSVVTPGKVFPPGSMIMGNPARLIRPLNEEELQKYGKHYDVYCQLASAYQSKVGPV